MCMIWDSGPVSSFCMWVSSFPNTIYWRYHPIPIIYFWLFCCKWVVHICVFISGFSILYHWSLCFSANTIIGFITITLWYNFKSGSVISCPLCSFILRIALVIWVWGFFFWFHINVSIFYSISVKSFDRDYF